MHYQREELSWASKQELLNRQLGKCRHCDHIFYHDERYRRYGRWVNEFTGEIRDRYTLLDVEFHHIVPVSQGGGTNLENMEAVCFDCHAKLTKELRYAKTRA